MSWRSSSAVDGLRRRAGTLQLSDDEVGERLWPSPGEDAQAEAARERAERELADLRERLARLEAR